MTLYKNYNRSRRNRDKKRKQLYRETNIPVFKHNLSDPQLIADLGLKLGINRGEVRKILGTN